ncbi:DUF6085 family protein [Lentzea cavernae]|uniref:Uncharacterized protein n=1 Tax=Lentzea cavernae TaxID=2020703 RepID=A0ABQ3MU79_9PSEU|nr:DUF6085 family protein [Lentzea cavernae]GHH57571.1 hypothetical protein GCM10017774_77310 [Lentzea cavernae]
MTEQNKAPEVRLSPDRTRVALRFEGREYWTAQGNGSFEALMSDEDVADWTPLVPDDGQREHVIDVREDGWTIKHPMSCRSDLFACEVNRAAGQQIKAMPAPAGKYECGLDGAGVFSIGKAVTS